MYDDDEQFVAKDLCVCWLFIENSWQFYWVGSEKLQSLSEMDNGSCYFYSLQLDVYAISWDNKWFTNMRFDYY